MSYVIDDKAQFNNLNEIYYYIILVFFIKTKLFLIVK